MSIQPVDGSSFRPVCLNNHANTQINHSSNPPSFAFEGYYPNVRTSHANGDISNGNFVMCGPYLPYRKTKVMITGTKDPSACRHILEKIDREFRLVQAKVENCKREQSAQLSEALDELMSARWHKEQNSIWSCHYPKK